MLSPSSSTIVLLRQRAFFIASGQVCRRLPTPRHVLYPRARLLSDGPTADLQLKGSQRESPGYSSQFPEMITLVEQTKEILQQSDVTDTGSLTKQAEGEKHPANGSPVNRAAVTKKSMPFRLLPVPQRIKKPINVSKALRKSREGDAKSPSEYSKNATWKFKSGLRTKYRRGNWREENFSSNGDVQRIPSYVRRTEGLIEHSEHNVLEELEPPIAKIPIATLAHGLDRVLFNPGVHWVQDPRSGVYNFTPFLQRVPDIKDFAFERLTRFVKSSRDKTMQDLAAANGKRLAGSTSSLTGLLCHIYFLLSQNRGVDVSTLAEPFSTSTRTFTRAQRMPTAVVFNHHHGIYLIDSDSTDNDDSQWNVLGWMGTMLESFLTLPKSDFGKLLRSVTLDDSVEKRQGSYRYSQSELFVMRSQLDCVDARLPGSGVFDIKTRAALPIRMDNLNFKENSGYLITSLHGTLNSFDREYYDLIRSAFLKYSFQARIGGMDGILLAYHNTARIFGFQYVSLEEMDERLFGGPKMRTKGPKLGQHRTGGTELGWRIFRNCVGMLEAIAKEVVECFPGKSVACLVEASPRRPIMRIWVQPIDEGTEMASEGDEIPAVTPDLENPIIQLDVTAQNYLGGAPAIGPDAVCNSKKPWTVHWSISRSSLPEKAIRVRLAAARKRKSIPWPYPTGVNSENIEEFIRNLGFGDHESVPDTRNFKAADSNIHALRRISKAGRLASQQIQSDAGTKVVQMWQQVKISDPSYHQPFPSDNDIVPKSAGRQNEPAIDDSMSESVIDTRRTAVLENV